MSWERVLKTPPRVDEFTRAFELGVKAAKEGLGTTSTPPFKGNQYREKHGWTDKLNTLEDTIIFLHVLDDIDEFSKREIFYFLENPYKWQNEYEIFKKAMDLLEDVRIPYDYGGHKGEDTLNSENFAEWFLEHYGYDGWDKLSNELRELEQVKEKKE
tara:strand:+ start:131 stop:601 length:471 start_codon:yes stop_codon:yes gene_type:complete